MVRRTAFGLSTALGLGLLIMLLLLIGMPSVAAEPEEVITILRPAAGLSARRSRSKVS